MLKEGLETALEDILLTETINSDKFIICVQIICDLVVSGHFKAQKKNISVILCSSFNKKIPENSIIRNFNYTDNRQ